MPFIADSRSQTVSTTLFVPMRLYAGLIFITSALIAMPDGSLWLAPAKAAVPASVIVSLQLLVGAALVAGAFTPYAAMLGVSLLVHVLAVTEKIGPLAPVNPGELNALSYMLITLACARAGMAFGVDALRARRSGAPATGLSPRWALVIMRVYLGAAFLRAAWNKVGAEWSRWPQDMAAFAGRMSVHSIPIYRSLLVDVVFPHINFFAPAVTIAEITVGICLVTGTLTRAAAVLGAFLTLNYMLMKGSTIWMPSNDPVFILGSLTVAAGAAGRAFGIDYFLHRRFPRLPAA